MKLDCAVKAQAEFQANLKLGLTSPSVVTDSPGHTASITVANFASMRDHRAGT